MFILLLMVCQVKCDWVEISQSDYRKLPIHKQTANFESTTKASAERQWSRGVVDKVSPVGNVRRVQFPSVKTSSLNTFFEESVINKRIKDLRDTPDTLYSFVPNTYNKLSDKINKDTELAILSNTDVDQVTSMQPDVNVKSIIKSPASSFNRRPITHDEKDIDDTNISHIYTDRQVETNKMQFTQTNNKEIEKIDVIDKSAEKSDIRRVFQIEDETKQRFQPHSGHRHFGPNNRPNTQKVKLFPKYGDVGTPVSNAEENYIYKKKQIISVDSDLKYINNSDSINYQHQSTVKPPVGDSHSTDELDYSIVSSNVRQNDYTVDSDKPTATFVEPNTNLPDLTNKKNSEETTPPETENILTSTNGNTVRGIWKLLKMVTDIIYKNTHRSFKSKIKYLESLKSTILTSIEDQIDGTWPDDVQDVPTGSRRTRSAQARGHVEFPSSESTLMTISFLTFAVFLIKLVLQVIHTYKNKTMMVTPTVVAAVGRAAAALKSDK